MLAVAILVAITFSIYRFVESTLVSVRISTEAVNETALLESVTGYLRHQLQALPIGRPGAIFGEAHRFNGVSQDELGWVATAGSGLLTRNAEGEWTATLALRRNKEKGGFDLGLRRQDVDGKQEPGWLPLLPEINALEVRYFDPRAAAWMEKWTDNAFRPTLVKVKLWRGEAKDAYETIIPIPIVPLGPQLTAGDAQNVPNSPNGQNGLPVQPGQLRQPGAPIPPNLRPGGAPVPSAPKSPAGVRIPRPR